MKALAAALLIAVSCSADAFSSETAGAGQSPSRGIITDVGQKPGSNAIAVIVRRGRPRPASGIKETILQFTGTTPLDDVWTDLYICDGDSGEIRQVLTLAEDVADEGTIAGWTPGGEAVFDLGDRRPTRRDTPERTWRAVAVSMYGGLRQLPTAPGDLDGKPYFGESRVMDPGFNSDDKTITKSTGAGWRVLFRSEDGFLVSHVR